MSEWWLMSEEVSSKNVTVTIPPGAAPGTRLTVRRTGLAGAGTMTVLTSGDDSFNRPGGCTALVLTAPFQSLHFEYARTPVEGERETEGFWHLTEPPPLADLRDEPQDRPVLRMLGNFPGPAFPPERNRDYSVPPNAVEGEQ